MRRGLKFWLMMLGIIGGMAYLTYRIQGVHEAIVWLIGMGLAIGIILLLENVGKPKKKQGDIAQR